MSDYESVIQALESPGAYPERPAQIEHLQTHISHLFLTPEHVYKVKKPVDFGFLDFSTLEKRRAFCYEELALNRRLGPDVYLEVVKVRRGPGGRIAIAGSGEVMEHAVKMRRLPADRSLDRLLTSGQVTEDMVRDLGRIIGEFHLKAEASPKINDYGSPEAIADTVDENFRQTAAYINLTISSTKYGRLKEYSEAFQQRGRGLFERRIDEGRIRDCHGDLHCAQVFFTDRGVRIIDCIEFTQRFRYSDVASDIAFMAMDLDQAGRHDLSRVFVDACLEVTKDAEAQELLDFYKVYRAYVRGKVESFRLDDLHIPQQERDAASQRARGYFNQAYFYTQKRFPPKLVVCAGMVGTGKSTIARYIAADGGLTVISSDVVRKRLAGVAPMERHYEAFGAGLYSPEFSRRTYDEVLRLARQYLMEGHSVVLDATFGSRSQREAAAALAGETQADFWAVECVASEQEIHERLRRRQGRQASVSDGRWEIYQREKATFEPLSEVPEHRHVTVSTSSRSVAESVRFTLQELEVEPA